MSGSAPIGDVWGTTKMERRGFLAAGATALWLAGCGGGGTSVGTRTLSLIEPGTQTLDWAPINLAQVAGLYRAQGLQVKTTGATIASQVLQQLIAGDGLIGRTTTFAAVEAIANERAPLVVVATDFQESANVVVSLARKPIRSVSELAGQTVGVGTLLGGNAQVLSIELQRAGVPSGAVTRIAVGQSAAAFGFLQDHRVVAILAETDKLAIMQESDPSLVSFNLTGPGPVFGVSYVVSREILRSHRTELVGFLRATRQAMERIIDPSTRIAALHQLRGMGFAALQNEVVAERAVRQLVQAWEAAGPSNLLRNVPAPWERDVAELIAVGALHPGTRSTDLYTNEVVDAAST